MKSALKTLTRIQKFQIDEQRKILSELQEKQDILQAQLEQLNRDFEQEKNLPAIMPEWAISVPMSNAICNSARTWKCRLPFWKRKSNTSAM